MCPCFHQEDKQHLPGRSGREFCDGDQIPAAFEKKQPFDGRRCCTVFPPGPRPVRQAQLSVLPSLTLHLSPCSQVFLWAPWTWCWTPVPAWPLTGSCTRPRTRRSTGRWRVVGALDPEGGREGGDAAQVPRLAVAPRAQQCPSAQRRPVSRLGRQLSWPRARQCPESFVGLSTYRAGSQLSWSKVPL